MDLFNHLSQVKKPLSKPHCTYETIYEGKIYTGLKHQERCPKIAKELCHNEKELINFFSLHFCVFNESIILLSLSSLIAIFFIFRYVSIVIDEYCVTGITKITRWLKLSQSLAGVTLLALANGSGDVITALVASDSEEGIYYNIGSIYGAGLFICCVVIGYAAIKQETILYDRMIVLRDISLYIIATFLTFVYGYFGEINWWNSLILLFLYIIQIGIVLFQDYDDRNNSSNIIRPLNYNYKGDNELVYIGQGNTRVTNENSKLINKSEVVNRDERLWEEARKSFAEEGVEAPLDVDHKKLGLIKMRYIGRKKIKSLTHYSRGGNLEDSNMMIRNTSISILDDEENEEKSILFKIIDFPFELLSYFTLLPVNLKDYSFAQTLIWSFTGITFQYFTILRFKWSLGDVVICVITCLFYFFSFLLLGRADSTPGVYKWIVLNSVISSISWMYFLIEILLCLLDTIGVVFNLDSTFLGLTILAIGNALTDMLSTLALFEIKNQQVLALSGAYNGQLFGILVGFGLANLKMSLHYGAEEFRLFHLNGDKEKILSVVVIGLTLFVLILTFGVNVCGGFKVRKGFGYFLIFTYICFFAFVFWFCVISKWE